MLTYLSWLWWCSCLSSLMNLLDFYCPLLFIGRQAHFSFCSSHLNQFLVLLAHKVAFVVEKLAGFNVHYGFLCYSVVSWTCCWTFLYNDIDRVRPLIWLINCWLLGHFRLIKILSWIVKIIDLCLWPLGFFKGLWINRPQEVHGWTWSIYSILSRCLINS